MDTKLSSVVKENQRLLEEQEASLELARKLAEDLKAVNLEIDKKLPFAKNIQKL